MRERGGQTRVNSPELTRGSSPARPGTAEGVGIPPPVTKWPAEGSYVTLKIPRVEWCGQLGRGRPISTAASSKAAAGVRASTTWWLQRVSRRAEERVGTLGTWRARGSYWSERKSPGARGSPAMAMAGARCLRGRQLRHENEQGVRGETERSSRGLRRWPRGARGGVREGTRSPAISAAEA